MDNIKYSEVHMAIFDAITNSMSGGEPREQAGIAEIKIRAILRIEPKRVCSDCACQAWHLPWNEPAPTSSRIVPFQFGTCDHCGNESEHISSVVNFGSPLFYKPTTP